MSESMTIPGVPETITREQYTGLIESLGIEVTRLRKLEFRPDGVYVEMLAVNSEGRYMVDEDADGPVVHRVFVRMDDARHG